MRALLIYRVDISDVSNQGVSKKMQGHLYGLLQNGYEVDVIYLNDKGLYFNNQLLRLMPKSRLAKNFFKAVTFYRSIIANTTPEDYDLVLIRHHLILPGFIDTLRHFDKVKMVVDLPTYPYDREFRGVRGQILLRIDGRNRVKLKEYVDFILHYGLEKELFGIPCLNVSNGILPQAVNLEKKETKLGGIQLLAVGKWAYWHGLDRVIDGLSGNEAVVLNVVGEGPAMKDLRQRSAGKQNIVFHGSLKGRDLDSLYDKADLGIGTLGIHRKGVKIDSSLKHRAYCLRGLPFILSTRDLDFPEDLGFVKYFDANDKPISSEEMVNFYFSFTELAETRARMLEYGRANLDWSKKMEEVIEAFQYSD